MTTEAEAPVLVEGHIATGDKGLKSNALGFMSNLVIGVASTAPAYSLAATLGFIVVIQGVGVKAPAVLIVSFVPILFVSLGYRYLNKADPDAGTTFAWTTRAFGPYVGWINGWAIFAATPSRSRRGLAARERVVVQPVRDLLQRSRRRRPARHLHLLG